MQLKPKSEFSFSVVHLQNKADAVWFNGVDFDIAMYVIFGLEFIINICVFFKAKISGIPDSQMYIKASGIKTPKLCSACLE